MGKKRAQSARTTPPPSRPSPGSAPRQLHGAEAEVPPQTDIPPPIAPRQDTTPNAFTSTTYSPSELRHSINPHLHVAIPDQTATAPPVSSRSQEVTNNNNNSDYINDTRVPCTTLDTGYNAAYGASYPWNSYPAQTSALQQLQFQSFSQLFNAPPTGSGFDDVNVLLSSATAPNLGGSQYHNGFPNYDALHHSSAPRRFVSLQEIEGPSNVQSPVLTGWTGMDQHPLSTPAAVPIEGSDAMSVSDDGAVATTEATSLEAASPSVPSPATIFSFSASPGLSVSSPISASSPGVEPRQAAAKRKRKATDRANEKNYKAKMVDGKIALKSVLPADILAMTEYDQLHGITRFIGRLADESRERGQLKAQLKEEKEGRATDAQRQSKRITDLEASVNNLNIRLHIYEYQLKEEKEGHAIEVQRLIKRITDLQAFVQ